MTTRADPQIILASSSPQRRELLSRMGLSFSVVAPEVDEIPHVSEAAAEFAKRLAVDKAHAVTESTPVQAPPAGQVVVIAADTVVTLDGHILGKPADEDHAREMLHHLSGETHEVITGLCIRGRKGSDEWHDHARAVRTSVCMKPLSAAEIDDYIRTGEPMDKAGAYAIQGKAAYMVRAISGSYTNVVGLPLTELAETLSKGFGLPLVS